MNEQACTAGAADRERRHAGERITGGENEAQVVKDRVQTRTHLWSQANGLPVSVSLGCSLAPRDGLDLLTFLSVADIALYRNKAAPIGAGYLAAAPETS